MPTRPDDGRWQLFLGSTRSGGGNATLNSWTLDIHLVSAVPEPGSFYAALALLLLLLATQLLRQMDPRRLLCRPVPQARWPRNRPAARYAVADLLARQREPGIIMLR